MLDLSLLADLEWIKDQYKNFYICILFMFHAPLSKSDLSHTNPFDFAVEC